MRQATRERIVLNVYDLVDQVNQYAYPIGLGAFHSGVEIMGTEYSFGRGEDPDRSGIFGSPPGSILPLRESIVMGEIDLSPWKLEELLDEMRPQYAGTAYHPLLKNCNHFCDDLCQRLVQKPIPSYINRLAWMASYARCLLPPEMASGPNGPLPTPGPETTIRFPGAAQPISNDVQSIAPPNQEEMAKRRERHAQAALKRMQSHPPQDLS